MKVNLMSTTNKTANINEISKPRSNDLFTPNFGMKYSKDTMYIGQTKIVPSNEAFMVTRVEVAPETLLMKYNATKLIFGRTMRIPPKKGCPNSASKTAKVTTLPPTRKYNKYLIIKQNKYIVD